MTGTSIGVIGGGFTGSLLALHLLERLPAARVYLFEKRQGFGVGLAYSTENPHHLLNVRSARMSAFEDDPGHFLRWLEAAGQEADPDGFAPRQAFGAYVQHLLAAQVWTEGRNRNLYLVPDEAVGLECDAEGVTIALAGGRPVRVQAAILATGNFPPESPPVDEAVREAGRFVNDPWDIAQVERIGPADPVLIIGSGLTMVDFVLGLLDRGHMGALQVVSRRGLLPHCHAEQGKPVPWPEDFPSSLATLLSMVRHRCGERGDWRAVVDGLRPHVQGLWAGWSAAERRRFLRHVRPWWDIHRHRIAPRVADRIDVLVAQGRLSVTSAKIVGISPAGEGVDVAIRPRGGHGERHLRAAVAVNCSGPASDYQRIRQPLIQSLLRDGVVRPDSLRLGLDVTSDLRAVAADGFPSERLYAAGPATKGLLWEITAVPEIRGQCRTLAERIAQRFGGG